MRFYSNIYALAVLVGVVSIAADPLFSQDDVSTKSSPLVGFASDVWPILQEHCLECHGPNKAKNDFRVDQQESLMAYIEPGSAVASSLWTDYLTTDDPDMKMPPPDSPHAVGMSGTKLAVIKTWIEEGAKWETPPTVVVAETTDELEVDVSTLPLANRIWIFQGLFHPASVHFPIALLLVSSAFFLSSFVWRKPFEQVAFHCLWVGAVTSIATCVMGWAYAQHEGYGAGFSFALAKSPIDRHRWLGIVVSAISLALIPVAYTVRKNRSINGRIIWTMGSLILMVGVSIVGFQGGELVYGEGHYEKEFERLFKTPAKVSANSGKMLEDGEVYEEAATDSSAVNSELQYVDESELPANDVYIIKEDAAVGGEMSEADDLKNATSPSNSDDTPSSNDPTESSDSKTGGSEKATGSGSVETDAKSASTREMAF